MRSLFILALISTALTVQAQKFGYMNSNVVLQSLPEVAEADAQLRTMRDKLEADIEKKAKAFQVSYQAYLNEVEEGLLSKLQMQEREQILTKSQTDLRNLEQQSGQTMAAKREELLQPILNRVDEAIQAVGKEGGYTFIFDTGANGTLLYAPEGDDVTDTVLAKLGAQ